MLSPKTRTLSFLPLLLAVLLVLPACLGPATVAAPPSGQASAVLPASQSPAASPAGGISIQGEGRATVVPDQVEVWLGVSVKAAALEEAQKDASARMGRVMEKLTSLGLPKGQIKTVRFTIFPQYSQNQVLTGYQVDNIVSAKTKAIDKVGELLDGVVAAGANRVESISFTVADPKPLTVKAREDAMADAKAKAEQLARLAGVRLGRPTLVAERVAGTPPMPLGLGGGGKLALATPISPGEMEITVNVQVTYAIE